VRGWGASQFFLPGITRVWDKRAVRVYNKLGRAYGFSVDNAYVLNVETGQAFFLTAAVYTNHNGTVPGSFWWTQIGLCNRPLPIALLLATTLPAPEQCPPFRLS
jgi:hypothetical protein